MGDMGTSRKAIAGPQSGLTRFRVHTLGGTFYWWDKSLDQALGELSEKLNLPDNPEFFYMIVPDGDEAWQRNLRSVSGRKIRPNGSKSS
jgi:hypothetical protein